MDPRYGNRKTRNRKRETKRGAALRQEALRDLPRSALAPAKLTGGNMLVPILFAVTTFIVLVVA